MELATKNKDLMYVGLAAASLLLVPMVGMLVSDAVAWGSGDFFVAGVLLVGAAVTFRFFTRRANRSVYRYAMGISVATLLLLIWSNLAVGLIGHAGYRANLMYFAVVVIGLVGMGIVRGQARGMVWVMSTMALVQSVITALALLMGLGETVGSSPAEILMINGAFILLFAASAYLFQKVAKIKGAQSKA